ncbi:Tubulin delta chain, partial [Ophiophagus hannah]
MNLIRKEAEKCDRLGGFLMIMSMAGGTGSGLGAFVTAALRESYPNSFLLNHVIWPYGTGEVMSFQDPALYTSWLNPPETLRIWNTPRAFNKYEKSASLVSNSQFLLNPLNSLVGKAWKMFASK